MTEYRQKMTAATKGRGREPFPKIRGRTDGFMFNGEEEAPKSGLPIDPGTKVHLSDLNWSDKERVLRLLFAKINSVQGTVRRMPDHSLGYGHQPQPPATELGHTQRGSR